MEHGCDESRISNVQKPGRMIAMCCCRTVGKMTSGEQGQAVTIICDINVEILCWSAAHPQSMGYATGYGWMNAEMFVLYLKHFTNTTKAYMDCE